MCEFCKVEPNGDVASIPIISERSTLLSADIKIEAEVLKDKLNICILSFNEIYIDRSCDIKYCPMCGRKLNE